MIYSFDLPKYYKVEIDDNAGTVRVFSESKHAKGRELSQFYTPDGYLRVKLNNVAIQIHSLVAKYFLGDRPKGLVVNHKDGNKTNNRPSNLEYVSISENIHHAIRSGLHICCNPENMPTYIDGRSRDKTKYKNEWYLKNRERILQKTKERYLEKKNQNESILT